MNLGYLLICIHLDSEVVLIMFSILKRDSNVPHLEKCEQFFNFSVILSDFIVSMLARNWGRGRGEDTPRAMRELASAVWCY
jgi:hypothetical protein